jgi:hypothetical protein
LASLIKSVKVECFEGGAENDLNDKLLDSEAVITTNESPEDEEKSADTKAANVADEPKEGSLSSAMVAKSSFFAIGVLTAAFLFI